MKTMLALATALLATGFGQAAAESPPPDWYLEEIELLTSGSGRWEADNVAYKSDEEQFDTYSISRTASGRSAVAILGKSSRRQKPMDSDYSGIGAVIGTEPRRHYEKQS
ncbi:MAG: hypothetical protein WBM80_08610 [Woeseiaceae bacterium]